MEERAVGTKVAHRPPNLLGWATVASAAELDSQAKLYAVTFILIGFNIFADNGPPPFVPGFVKPLGIAILALGVVMAVIFLRPEDLILKGRPGKREGSRVNRLNATLFIVLVFITSLMLVTVVASTGGPLISPFSEYLVGELLLAQLLAPTVQAAWSAFVTAAVLFVAAELPIWFHWISGSRLAWPPRHYLMPIVVVAIVSTWANVSAIAVDARKRRAESAELVRARPVGEASS